MYVWIRYAKKSGNQKHVYSCIQSKTIVPFKQLKVARPYLYACWLCF